MSRKNRPTIGPDDKPVRSALDEILSVDRRDADVQAGSVTVSAGDDPKLYVPAASADTFAVSFDDVHAHVPEEPVPQDFSAHAYVPRAGKNFEDRNVVNSPTMDLQQLAASTAPPTRAPFADYKDFRNESSSIPHEYQLALYQLNIKLGEGNQEISTLDGVIRSFKDPTGNQSITHQQTTFLPAYFKLTKNGDQYSINISSTPGEHDGVLIVGVDNGDDNLRRITIGYVAIKENNLINTLSELFTAYNIERGIQERKKLTLDDGTSEIGYGMFPFSPRFLQIGTTFTFADANIPSEELSTISANYARRKPLDLSFMEAYEALKR